MKKIIELKNNKYQIENDYPKSFKGIYNYDKQFTEEQYFEHGWRDLVIPVIDESLERLGKLKKVLNEKTGELTHYTYEVVPLIGEEIAHAVNKVERNDEAAQFFNDRKRKGNQAFLDYSYRVFRKVKNGTITKTQAVTVLTFFYEAILPLKDGMFEIALGKVQNLSTNNQGLNDEKALIISKINNLINGED